MWHIVEYQSAHSQGAHIIYHRCFAQLLEGVVCAAEFQRNEGVETSRSILQITQTQQVVYAVVDALDMTIEHCGIGVETRLVSLLVHLQPLCRGALLGAYLAPYNLIENLGTTTRNRLHTRLFEQLQALLNGESRLANHIVEFHRSKCLDTYLGHNLLDASNHLGIVVDIALGVYTSHDMYLGGTTLLASLDLRQDLLHRVVPRTLLALATTVGAEATLEDADIGRFEVEIFVVKHLVATLALLDSGSKLRQLPQRSLLPKEFGFGGIYASSTLNLGNNTLDSHTISVLCGRGILLSACR